MSKQPSSLSHFFLPDLCNSRAVLILLAVSEALVLALTLIENSLNHWSWQRFAIMSFFVQWVCLLSVAVICPLREYLARWVTGVVVAVVLLVIMLVAALVSLVGEWLWSTTLGDIDWLWVGRNLLVSLIFGAMALRYFYVQSQWRLKTQAELRARLAALQANIRPHFFFNTLNTVASLIAIDPAKAETMLLDLSELFRAVLKNDQSLVPLAAEIHLGQRYLAIEQVRLGDERLSVDWQLPSSLPELNVPQLLLQPLLENAVYHGIQPNMENGFIVVALLEEPQFWCLTIRNSKPNRPAVAGNQLAQANIKARLAVLGKSAQLNLSENATEYQVQILLPKELGA